MTSSTIEAKQQIVSGCQILDERGIFDDQGHLSLRTESRGTEILITGNTGPGTASLQEIFSFDITKNHYPDTVPGETPIHSQIFKVRDDVNAVCHNHSPYAVIVSSVGLEMKPVHPTAAIQTGPVKVYEDYHKEGGMLITSDKEARELAKMLGDDRAIMLRGHGAVVVGETINQAILASIKLEFNSWMLYQQALVGEPWYVPDEIVSQSVEFAYNPEKMVKSLDYFDASTRD